MVVLVRKARTRKPTQAVIAPTFAEPITDVHRNIASIGNRLLEGWAALVAPLGGEGLHRAVAARDTDAIVAGLDWVAFTAAANALADPLRHTLVSFARLEVTPAERRRAIRKDRTAPSNITFTTPLAPSQMKRLYTDIDARAVTYAKQRSGNLIVHVNDDVRAGVRAAVARSVSGEMTVPQLARHLRSVVPLRPAQASSVARLRETMIGNLVAADAAKGITSDAARLAAFAAKVEPAVARAAATKLRQRAALVARTEVVAASNRGRYAAWESTTASGLTPTNSVKEWIAAPDACPDCAQFDGEQVPWDQPFSNGDDMPPDHPACRCSAVMLPPDAANDPQDPVYSTDPEGVPEPPEVKPDVQAEPESLDDLPASHPVRQAVDTFASKLGPDGPGVDAQDLFLTRVGVVSAKPSARVASLADAAITQHLKAAGLTELDLDAATYAKVKLGGKTGYKSAADALADVATPPPSGRKQPLLDLKKLKAQKVPDDYNKFSRAGYTNPLSGAGPEWRSNCHQVVSAAELRTRGFDVVARPTVGSLGRYNTQIAEDWVTSDGYVRPFTESSAALAHDGHAAMAEMTASWPVGARGFVSGSWNRGGGHIFNVEKTAAGLRYTEHQSAAGTYAPMQYIDNMKAPTLATLRVDDLVPSRRVLDAVEDASVVAKRPKPAGSNPLLRTAAENNATLHFKQDQVAAATKRVAANNAQLKVVKAELLDAQEAFREAVAARGVKGNFDAEAATVARLRQEAKVLGADTTKVRAASRTLRLEIDSLKFRGAT